MNTQDILNIFLMLALIFFLVCFGFITYFLILTLKAIRGLADNLEETAKDINSLKGSLKMKFLTALPILLASLAGKIIKKRR